MLKKLFISSMVLLLCFAFVNAQKKSAGKSVSSKPKETKIKLGTKNYAVKGSIFNEIKYLPPEKSKDVFYQFSDPKNKTLTISTVGYAIENNKVSASTFETIICPFDKIDKEKSYILEMENEAITNEKVYRMTLISKGQGADNLYFQRQFISIFTDEIQIVLVNNVTVFFKSKAEAEKWLKTFTK